MLTGLRCGLRWQSASLVPLLLALAEPASAIQRGTPQSIRVTSGASHHHPATRSWGRYFAYISPVDLTGGGFAGNQVYVLSLFDYMCQFGHPELQQADENPQPCPNPPNPYLVRATDGNITDLIDDPSVNSAGNVVAFSALGSFHGFFGGDAGKHRQVFVKNLVTGQVIPVTGNPDGDSYLPSLNDAGGSVTFVSTANLQGHGSGIAQVFVYHVPDRTLTQVSIGQAPSGAPMLNMLGDHVVFESRGDLLNTGADTGIWNIFWFDRQTLKLFQVTNGNADSRDPYIEEKRPGAIWFDSAATTLTANVPPPGTRQIYRAPLDDSGNVTAMEQWTNGPGNAWNPAVEPNGIHVAFLSDGDLLQNGTVGARLFAIDFKNPAAKVLYQITGRGNIMDRIGANIGTWFASFDSDDDVGGYGTCGRQIWIVVYDLDHYVDAGHVRLPATVPGQVPGEPFPGNPNAGCDDADGCSNDVCVGGQTCTHTPKPENAVCADGNICTGVATCKSGKCTQQGALDCDDKDACTTDTCDPNTGCGHAAVTCNDGDPCSQDSCDPKSGCLFTPLKSMQGVACQNTQVEDATPSQAQKKVLKQLRKAQRLVQQATTKKPKAAQRKLSQAAHLFQSALPNISKDSTIPPVQASDLVQRIYALLDQIASVLSDLKNQTGGGK
jgi:hypothetical protein